MVLGASGAMGKAVVAELTRRNLPMRQVERSVSVRGATYVAADLLKEADAVAAIEGASHVYVCVGIPYAAAVWAREWPIVMQNVISAAERAKAVVVFFDNMYMYGPSPLQNPIREDHPQSPESKKGKVRKMIADMLLAEHANGRVKAVIGRSADFYGPGARNSLLYITVLDRMLKGKNPQWLGPVDVPHSFAYTLDNGRALVTLALDEGAYGSVWHLPVATPTPTVAQMIEKISRELTKTFTVSVMPPLMMRLLAPFIPPLKEASEMVFQVRDPYVFSDAKFRARYPDFATTSLDDGIAAMVADLRK